MSSYTRFPDPAGGIKIYPSVVDFPADPGKDGVQAVAADTNTIYIYDTSIPGWAPVANPGAAIAIDGLMADVSATGPGVVNATVNSVGGASAADVATSVSDTQAATNAATAGTIAKRDLNSEINLKGLNLDGSVAGTINIYPAATTTNYSVKLPAAQGAASSVLQNDGAGNLSWTNLVTGVSNVTASAPLSSTGGATPDISISQASAMSNGYLSSTDWSTFNSKQNALTIGNLTSSDISVTGGTGAVIGAGVSLSLTKGNLSESTSSVLTISGGTNAVLGSGTTIQVKQSSALQSGYLSSTDWSTFNNKQPAGSYITDLTGEVTATGPGSVAATIAANAVTNAKLAKMATLTIKGNNTAGLSDPLDLNATQATAILNNFVGDSGAGGTKGLVPAPAAGDAAAGKYLKADGSWATVSGLPTQTGNQYKVLATDGSAASWQYAGLGDGSFGTNNVVLGRSKPSSLSGTGNIICGPSAGNALGNSVDALLIGNNAYKSNTTAGSYSYALVIGNNAGQNLTGSEACVVIGNYAAQNLTTSNLWANTIIGNLAGQGTAAQASGYYNTIVGHGAAQAYLGTNSTKIGMGSGYYTSGTDNTFVGYNAGAGSTSPSSGAYNSSLGSGSLKLITTGASNCAVGYNAGSAITTGSNNTILGSFVGSAASSYVVSIGAVSSCSNNSVAIGKGAQALQTYGVAIGENALFAGTNGVALGYNSYLRADDGIAIGVSASTGPSWRSVVIGSGSGNGNFTGAALIVGAQSGTSLTNGANNTIIGQESGTLLSSGSSNVFLGYRSGKRSTTQSDELFIDNQDRSSYAAQQTDALIYGTFNATAGNQTLFVNAKQTVRRTTSATNTVTPVLQLDSESSGTPANGIGVSLEMAAETAAGNTEIGVVLEAVTTDVTPTSEDFDLVVKNMTNGATASEKLRVASSGTVTVANGDMVLNTAGNGLKIKTGADATAGLATILNGNSSVTVSTNKCSANSIILVTNQTSTAYVAVTTKTSGSFKIEHANPVGADQECAWFIINPA